MFSSRWIVLAGALFLASCANGAADESQPDQLTTRDSAGIEIVENDAPLWTETTRWRLADAPSLQIGAGVDDNADAQFGYVAGVHRLSNGHIAVLDAWAPSLNFFDSAGKFLGRAGRRGNGPGEFPRSAFLSSFTCGGDTVFVSYYPRVAVFAAPNTYVRTFSMQPAARIRACTRGRLVGQTHVTNRRSAPGVYVDSLRLSWYAMNGGLHSVIDSLPWEERDWRRGPEAGLGNARVVFGRSLAVTANHATLATGFSDRFQIVLRDSTGRIARVLRVAALDRQVSAEDVERFRAFVMNPYRGNDTERAHLDEVLKAAPGRPLPAFAELRFDRVGNLWARQYDHLDAVAFYDYSSWEPGHTRPRLDGPRHWIVLRRDGRYLGAVTTPAEFTVHEIGDDWILGVWRDELDIQFVRQYALIKPRAD